MEEWLEKLIAQKKRAEDSAAEAIREEVKRRGVFDSKISEFWETLVVALNKSVQRYNQAQEVREKKLDFQRLPGFEIVIQKNALPCGSLRIKVDRTARCLQCDYTYRSATGTGSQERVTLTINAKHIGIPLSLTDPAGVLLGQDQISETILARFLTAV